MGDISIHVIKYPGEIIEGRDYSEAGFLACLHLLIKRNGCEPLILKQLHVILHTKKLIQ